MQTRDADVETSMNEARKVLPIGMLFSINANFQARRHFFIRFSAAIASSGSSKVSA
jgi:hypothetical protein